MAPADPALVLLTMDGNTVPTTIELAQKRKELGLDNPFFVQYMSWFCQVIKGSWGNSYITNKPVFDEVIRAASTTIKLTIMSLIWVVITALPLGIVMAIYEKKVLGKVGFYLTLIFTSIPSFWLAILSIQIFSEELALFPTSGFTSLHSLVLPSIVLGVFTIGLVARMQFDSLRLVLKEPYLMTAQSKGLPYWYIVYAHALKNSWVSVITLLGNYVVGIIGGATVIEIIFSLPGLGTLILEAIRGRDYPMIQGYVLIVGVITIIINSLVDLLHLYLQPKLRLRRDL